MVECEAGGFGIFFWFDVGILVFISLGFSVCIVANVCHFVDGELRS